MWMDGLAPALVWGLIPRFVGLLYIIAFGALIPQHDIMPGSRELLPLQRQLSRIRRDYPGIGKYFRFPTLLWLNSSDTAVRAIPYVGALSGAGAIYGGPWSLVWLLLGYMCWVSLELRGLYFPWDTMLQEVGFLVLFVPPPAALPSLEATALPLPDVAFMFRWLMLRLMLGFAKDKFVGTTAADKLYLRGFSVWMPLPTPLGWLLHHAPQWFLRQSLYFMFYAELIAPCLGFFTGPLRVVSFISLSLLMVGIAATGNWGFFNYGYVLLCVCLLDVNASVFDLFHEPFRAQLLSWPDVGVHAIMLLLFLISLPYLLFDSWLSRAWVSWPKDLWPVAPKWRAFTERLHRVLEPLRWLAPFRIVNAYGVFPPNSLPPVRLQPVLEGSMDGTHFAPYEYKYMPSVPSSRLTFIAPYHARLDQWSYYVGQGIDGSSLFGGIFPGGNPYWAGTRFNLIEVMAQRLLRNDSKLLAGLGHNPFPDEPPRYVRIGLIALTPTSLAERADTGDLWRTQRLGTYAPARGLDPAPAELVLPEPELFMPEFVDWKRTARPLREIVAALDAGMPADRAVCQGSDLTAADVEQFWTEAVPLLAEGRGDWDQIHRYGAQLAERYTTFDLHRFERLLERFAWLLLTRTECYHWGHGEPQLPALSCFRYHKLLHEVVLDGREAYQAMLRAPEHIVARAQRSTLETELWAFSLLRYDHVMTFVMIFRSGEMGAQGHKEKLPGLFEYYELLSKVVPPAEDFVLRPEKHADGEHTVPHLYPPEWPRSQPARKSLKLGVDDT
jgi:Lipase maturation factor